MPNTTASPHSSLALAPIDDELAQSFHRLTLSNPPQCPSNTGFIGGFHPSTSPDGIPSQLSSSPPDRLSAMPTPWVPPAGRYSLTMQMALQQEGSPTPSSTTGANLSRPTPDTIATPVVPDTKSSSSPPPTPDRETISMSRMSSTSQASGNTQQCSGITKAGKRCTRQVKTGPAFSQALPDDDPDEIEIFCYQHQKVLMEPSGFYARKNGDWVKFEDWIPSYLQHDTQAALRVEMEKSRSSSDVPGYIYTFEIRDVQDGEVSLKVGRAVNLVKRIDQWEKQCGSKEQVLRGWYPGTVESNEGSLMKGRVQAGDKALWCHRLERLIHLELADLVATGIYLDSGWPHAPREDIKPLVNSSKKAVHCADCGAVHKEIFTFERWKGHRKGKEWELIVQPVVEKWGAFVSTFV